jgi:hypothetical protein
MGGLVGFEGDRLHSDTSFLWLQDALSWAFMLENIDRNLCRFQSKSNLCKCTNRCY